jgi:hypothetical protein
LIANIIRHIRSRISLFRYGVLQQIAYGKYAFLRPKQLFYSVLAEYYTFSVQKLTRFESDNRIPIYTRARTIFEWWWKIDLHRKHLLRWTEYCFSRPWRLCVDERVDFGIRKNDSGIRSRESSCPTSLLTITAFVRPTSHCWYCYNITRLPHVSRTHSSIITRTAVLHYYHYRIHRLRYTGPDTRDNYYVYEYCYGLGYAQWQGRA